MVILVNKGTRSPRQRAFSIKVPRRIQGGVQKPPFGKFFNKKKNPKFSRPYKKIKMSPRKISE